MKYEYITLNEFIQELTKFQKKYGDKAILSIGSSCGTIRGMSSPHCFNFAGSNTTVYVPAYKDDIKEGET